ncbi:MAG: hypothetical protein FWE27_06540 [Defluviitaleaceae bacterium]|nr:hypothetical protein [Defluviitaleaceae bacterium]
MALSIMPSGVLATEFETSTFIAEELTMETIRLNRDANLSSIIVGESTTETIRLSRNTDISDIIPDGVTPIFVETLEELEDVLEFIAAFENDLRHAQLEGISNCALLPTSFSQSTQSTQSAQHHIHMELAEHAGGTGWGMRIRFNAHVSYSNNPNRIFSVSPYTVMTGFGVGYSWTQLTAGTTPATIPSGGLSSVTAWASGVIEWYVIHPNLITFHNIPVSFSNRIGW